MRQLQGDRLLEDLDVDVEPEPRAEHRANEPEPAHRPDLQRDERGLHDHPPEREVRVLRDHGVDDELGCGGDGEGQKRSGDSERSERERPLGRGAVNERDGAWHVREARAEPGEEGQGGGRGRLWSWRHSILA